MVSDPLFGKAAWKDTVLEKDFQEQVSHLAVLNKWMVYSIPDSRRATMSGWPDLTMVKNGRIIFAELKRKGGRVSDAQKHVLAELGAIPCAEVYTWYPADWQEIENRLKGKA